MLLVVEENEALDPADVSTLSAQAEVLDADDRSYLIEKFWTIFNNSIFTNSSLFLATFSNGVSHWFAQNLRQTKLI